MKTKILEFFFGRKAKPVDTIKIGYHTVNYNTYCKDFGEWCKEFNVSMLYDKKPLHFN